MKNRIKAILSIALCLSMILTFAACATTSPSPSAGTQTSGTPAAGSETPSGEEVTLTFWHIWGSGDSNSKAVEKVINDFQTANPGIKIDVQTYENEAYKTTIRTNVNGDTAPDVFSAWGGGFSKPFVEAGKVLKMDDYLADGTMDKLKSGALQYFSYDSGVYGLTFGMSVSGLFCNNRLFEENNVKIPTTWDELMTAVSTFKAAGIIPISTSIQERWVAGMMFEGLCLKAVGADQMLKTLSKSEGGTFSDAQYLNAANKILELLDAGAFPTNATAISRDEAEIPVKNGTAAMYYMGSWAAGAVNGDDCTDKGNFTYVPFPTIADGNGKNTEFNGGGADGVMISNKTAHPEEAAKFVKYFCENLARENYEAGNYLPLWSSITPDESKVNPVMAGISSATSDATAYVLWWDNFLEGADVTTYQDALEKLLLKTITPDQFVEELKKIQP